MDFFALYACVHDSLVHLTSSVVCSMILILVPFLLPVFARVFATSLPSSSSTARTRIESLRARMHSVAGSRDTISEKSPIDSMVLNGRFHTWLNSNCSDTSTEACMEYFASFRTPGRVLELMDEIFTPIEAILSRDEIEASIEQLSAEIDEVESELATVRSEYEQLELKKYIQNQKSHHSDMEFSGRNRNFILQHINEPLRATSELPPAKLGDKGCDGS